MSAVVGTLLLSMGVIVFGWSVVRYRRPDPARWTRWGWLMQIIIFVTLALLSFGAVFLIRAAVNITEDTPSLGHGAAIVVILGLLYVSVKSLRAQWWQLHDRPAASVETLPRRAATPPGDGEPKPPPVHAGGQGRPSRGKAA